MSDGIEWQLKKVSDVMVAASHARLMLHTTFGYVEISRDSFNRYVLPGITDMLLEDDKVHAHQDAYGNLFITKQ